MNQDGSDGNIILPDVVQSDSETRGPRFMLLNLLKDNGDTSKHWELVPLVNSYNEAVQQAMIAFHKLLPEEDFDPNADISRYQYELDAKDIVLKYGHPVPNGSFAWAGLSAAMESNGLWNEVTKTNGNQRIVLGVSFHDMGSLAHIDGMPKAMYFFSGTNRLLKKTERRPVPPTYQHLRRLVYTILKKDFENPPDNRPIVEIWSVSPPKWHKLDSTNYLKMLKTHSFNWDVNDSGIVDQRVVSIKIVSP